VPVSYFFEGLEGMLQHPMSGVAEEAATCEYEQMSSRETLEMMRAYYRITDPNVRNRVFELVKSLANGSPIE